MPRPRLITLEYLENLVKIQEEKERKEKDFKLKNTKTKHN